MGDIALFRGDCMRLLLDVPDRSVNAIITDPPYGIDFQSGRAAKEARKPKIANDKAPFVWFLPEAYRVLKDGGCALVFCRWDVVDAFRDAMQWAGFKVKSTLVWDRQAHGMGDLKASFAPTHDVILFGIKGAFAFPGKRPRDVISHMKVDSQHLRHPNEKPIALMEKLICDVTKSGETVCDPFMGSGTTGVACVRQGRGFVGMELDDRYFSLANERIDDVCNFVVGR